jgi:hypothetical protein
VRWYKKNRVKNFFFFFLKKVKIPVIMGQKVTKNGGGGDGIDKKSEKTGIKG